ncbi:MAG: carboxypeptidase regulatory-like domain-containing protein [Acidobacteria bacterium]|nr:carboxypeptidase regulatory-like domain-containing protein [Acidobacteriota bacterium]
MRFTLRFLSPFLLVILVLFTEPSIATTRQRLGEISGNIKGPTGIPLNDAFVRIFKVAEQKEFLAKSGIRSNQNGFFRAVNLIPGIYYLQVIHEGYETASTGQFEVGPDRKTALNITLRRFIEYVSNDEDPRNWNLMKVMRSSSDRRMIFRYQPADTPETYREKDSPFSRNGSMNMASSTPLGGGPHYFARPHTSRNGIVTNFAFSEPLSRRSRMIFSGQFDFGETSFWRVRDTIHYRPNNGHDYKVSFGYGRMNVDYAGSDSLESQFLTENQGTQASRIQTIAFGIEGTTKFYDLIKINYGFDYSRLHYGTDRSFLHPSLEIVMTPLDGWRFKTSFSSRRESDTDSVMLSTGEVLNLSEPTLITVAGNDVSMSQVRHSEIAVERAVTRDTSIEVAVYRDNIYGPGIPLRITTITPEDQLSAVVHLNENRSRQQGLRISLNRQMLSNLRGSLGYVYGEATNLSDVDASVTIDSLNRDFGTYAIQQYNHTITGQLDANIPDTSTNLLATILWYPGNPVSPINWFSDPMDIGSKSVNFEVRQMLPIQSFFSSTGQWEILLDFRNILNQGEEVVSASDGLIVLNRNPRSLRFGLSLNFH